MARRQAGDASYVVSPSVSSGLYDAHAAERQLRRYQGALARYFRVQEQDLALAGIDLKDKCVLDLGCGVGRLSRALVERGARAVVACDLSLPMVRFASRSSAHPRVSYLVCDGARLPLPDNSVDAAFALGTFEAIRDLTPFVREARRVVKPGGRYVFTAWNRDRWYPLAFLDGRQSGSVDHDAATVRGMLEASSFSEIQVRTIFFLPRQLFWGGLRIARLFMLEGIYVALCNVAARFLRRLKGARDRGWVLLVTSRSSTGRPVGDPRS